MKRLAAVVALSLASASCGASASIASTRDASVGTQYRRIFVMIEQSVMSAEHSDALSAALQREFNARHVTNQVRILRGLDLDEHNAQREAEAWKPEALLLVSFAGGTGGGNYDGVTHDVSLVELASGRRIWRGRAYARRHLGTTEGMAEETAAEVVERLGSDRLIAGESR